MFFRHGIKNSFHSLSTYLTFSIIIISLIILITNFINIYTYYSDTILMINNQKELISQKAAVKVKEYIYEKIKYLEKSIEVGDLANKPIYEQERILRILLGKGKYFSLIILMDDENKERIRVSRFSKYYSADLLKYGPDQLASNKIDSSKVYISKVWIDQNTCEPMMTIGIPVSDLFGNSRGALIAVTNLKFMWDLIKKINIDKNGLMYIVDKNGALIAFRDITRVLKGENVGQIKEVNKFIRGDSASHDNQFRIAPGILEKYSVTTHVHLNFPDWAVVIEWPVMEVYKPLIKIIIITFFSMIICFVVAIFTGKYLSQKIILPVKELRDTTKKISKGNLNANVIVKSCNEIGELASSFNEMINKLRNSTTSIKNLHNEIIERKLIETKLRESEEKFRTLTFSLPIGIVLVNNNGCILLTNPQWDCFFNQNISGRSINGWKQFIADEHVKKVEAAWKELLNKDKMFSEELRVEISEHKEIWLNVKALKLVTGNETKILIMAEDITSRKKAEAEAQLSRIHLLNSEKLAGIGQLAAGIAHEINNPLGFVLGNSETLKDYFHSIKQYIDFIESRVNKEKTDPKKNEYDMDFILNDVCELLNDNMEGMNRIVKIVKNLKDFARVEQNNEFIEANIEENLNRTITIAKNEIKYHSDIKTDFRNTSTVFCNISEINQVFLNIIVNAAQAIKEKYKSEKGLITVKTEEDEKNVYCSISDNGPGITEEHKSKIFEPFFTTKPVGKGTGLGLNLAWDIIVNRHKGKIIVKSETGKGTCFTIKLPKKRNETYDKTDFNR